jgi:hypothetical protein
LRRVGGFHGLIITRRPSTCRRLSPSPQGLKGR